MEVDDQKELNKLFAIQLSDIAQCWLHFQQSQEYISTRLISSGESTQDSKHVLEGPSLLPLDTLG